jgi:hypothetical protein
VQAVLSIMAPLIVNFIIDFIKTGENPYNIGWEIESFPWLTPAKQYGLLLILILVLSQFTALMILE